MWRFVLALVGIGVLGSSFFANWYLLQRVQALVDEKAKIEIQAASMQTALDFKEKIQQENDRRLKEFQAAVNQLTAQRDSYRRKMQEALTVDKEFSSWASGKLPAYVRESFAGMRRERESARSREGNTPGLPVSGDSSPR